MEAREPIKLDEETWRMLFDTAWGARENSYSPYSGFSIGAAILTSAGEVFFGTNVENASYGLTACAERVAMWNAVSSGSLSPGTLIACALVADLDARTWQDGARRREGFDIQPEIIAPCGACRQVLFEFAAPGCMIGAADGEGNLRFWTVAELLPDAFGRG